MYRKVQELEESLQFAHVPEADIGHVLFRVGRGLISKETVIFIFIEWGLYIAFYMFRMCLEVNDRYYGAHTLLLLNCNFITCLTI